MEGYLGAVGPGAGVIGVEDDFGGFVGTHCYYQMRKKADWWKKV